MIEGGSRTTIDTVIAATIGAIYGYNLQEQITAVAATAKLVHCSNISPPIGHGHFIGSAGDLAE